MFTKFHVACGCVRSLYLLTEISLGGEGRDLGDSVTVAPEVWRPRSNNLLTVEVGAEWTPGYPRRFGTALQRPTGMHISCSLHKAAHGGNPVTEIAEGWRQVERKCPLQHARIKTRRTARCCQRCTKFQPRNTADCSAGCLGACDDGCV
ncbi:hypothetical protein INR49_031175 [Caranx melampygus]|nr:hypothetical protein INR49_031175 [Caranx melampygus]